ncbi:MAG: ATP-binding protein [Sphaerospermopsis sp. SIO1G2]|nr:ATP-binding protein [Sphaerospermopsis sp. SIO1G2]
MNSQEALKFINGIFYNNEQEPLNELEENIFLCSWEKQEYKDIAAKIDYADTTVREVGAALWKKIAVELGITTTFRKHNFRKKIEDYYHTYSQRNNLSLIRETEDEDKHEVNTCINVDNTNPFIPTTGRIETLEKIFGREKEIQEIFELLNSSSSVAIIGEPQIGKSSLLYTICQQSEQFLKNSRQNVCLDMNNIYDQEDFYFAICDNLNIPESKGYRFNRSLKDKRVLLVLDNVGKLNGTGFTRDVRDNLRGLAEGKNSCLKLVVAANESLQTLFNDSYTTSPLADICQQVDILVWSEETCRNFITYRLKKTNITFTEIEIQELIQESGGHPQKLNQLCYDLYKKYWESNN